MWRLPFGMGRASARRTARAYAVEGLERRTLLTVPPLGPEFRVNTTTAAEQTTANNHRSVATDAAGNSVVIWESGEGVPAFGPLLYAQRVNAAGVKVGPEIHVTPPTVRGPFSADVAMDAGGDFVVVYDVTTQPFPGVYAQRYDAAGSAQGGAAWLANLPQPSHTRVAMDADGDYVVTWDSYDSFNVIWQVHAQRFDATGADRSGGPFFPNSDPNENRWTPSVAVDPVGNFVIAWERLNGQRSSYRIQARRFDSQGTPQGFEFDVTPQVDWPVIHNRIRTAISAQGDFAIVWETLGGNLDGSGYGIYGRRYTAAGAAQGGEFLLNTTTAGSQENPNISMDAGGDMTAVWTDGAAVVGQRFSPGGAKVSGEFRLDTISGVTSHPSVAMDYAGDLIAAWTGAQGADVYARVYPAGRNQNVGTGRVFQDVNANGVGDVTEPGMAGRSVYRDINNNGQLDTISVPAASLSSFTPLPPTSTRRYLGPGPLAAVGGVITDINVTLNIQHPNDGDLTAYLVSPWGQREELFNHVGATGDNFSQTTFDDSSPVPIYVAAAPFTGTYRTQNQTLSHFNGHALPGDGYWMLEVRNDGGSSGGVFNWVVNVTYAESSAVTDANGLYSLPLPDGDSTLRQVPQSGWVQTVPSGGAGRQAFAAEGQTIAGLDFGNAYPGTVSGGVFHDVNANQNNDAGEPLLGGWTVFADLNNNGQLDGNEPLAVSAAQLGYSLRGVPLGQPVTLRAVPLPTIGTPWEFSVAPAPVTLTAAQPGASLQNFGAFRRGSIAGHAFNDLDGDLTPDAGEPGLAGWTVYVDQNGNGVYDGPVATASAADVPTDLGSRTQSTLVVRDRVGATTDVNVTLDVRLEDVSGLSATLVSPLGRTVLLFDGLARGGANLQGTTLDDEARTPIREGRAPYSGAYLPVETLDAFDGEDANGTWTLQLENRSRAVGSLDGWSLNLSTTGEPAAVTDADGLYTFTALPPAVYSVREQPQPGWTRLSPPGGAYNVTLTSGQDLNGFDFANRPAAGAPRVAQVYARGSTWTSPFMNYLQAQGLGSGQYGFAIGGGAGQLLDLPWRNVNQISVAFSGDVQVKSSDLSVRGVNLASYPATAFVYDPVSHTATWTMAQAMTKDKVLLDLDGDAPNGVHAAGAGGAMLDGEWSTGGAFPSGNGTAGGDFKFRLNVLPGDVNRSGSVLADDFSAVKARFFRSTTSPGSGANTYSIFHDVDGSGSILADDFSAVKARFFNSLPGPEPAAAAVLVSSRGGRPATRGLFSVAAVLA